VGASLAEMLAVRIPVWRSGRVTDALARQWVTAVGVRTDAVLGTCGYVSPLVERFVAGWVVAGRRGLSFGLIH
jgi:hypothetical protein